MRVLLVEDDRRIASDISRALEAAGYVVETVRDGEEAWFRGDTEDYGAVILDLGLPGMDGLAVLKRWRANGRHMPVLILTARASWAERVDGIDAGADDYLPKPFRIEELLARLRSIVRRAAGHASSVVSAGEITLDERQMRVSVRGVPVTMSPLEYRLVAYLLRHRGRVVSQHELDENVYGHGEDHDSNALEVLIGRVRKKLGPELIETRRGFGYLVPEPYSMRLGSLRLRLVAGGIIAILAALTIAGAGLILLFERHVTRTMADDLDVHLKQLVAGVDVDQDGNLVMMRPPADPRFADALSGLYWQVSDDRDQLLRSRSLWDTKLAPPVDEPASGEIHNHEVIGPANGLVLVAERKILLTVGDRRVPVRLVVAADLARVATATAAFAKDIAVALGLLGLVLAIATSIQVGLGLRPLDAVRRGVAEIRSGRRRHLPAGVPAEVRPLVEEVNALLDAQEREIERSRSQAADLAHELKTPLAALASDAARLRERGETALAQDIEGVADAMSRHVDRELARARLRSAVRHRDGHSTALAPLVRSLVATLSRTSFGIRVTFEQHIAEDAQVPLDRTDLAEVLGNLLENAARHAAQLVRISVDSGTSIIIEDDGPGIPPAQWPRVLERGTRLDERGEGAGLGLAIVQDVLNAYGWRLELAKSQLGGLKATAMPEAS